MFQPPSCRASDTEADCLPTDDKELLDDYGLVGCDSIRSNDLSVQARIDSSGYVRLHGNQMMITGHAAIKEVKFGKETEGVTTESRERSAESLFDTLESVALAVEGSNLCANSKLLPRHQEEATGDQIRSLKTTMLCMPSPPRAGNEGTLSCSTVFQNGTSASVPL